MDEKKDIAAPVEKAAEEAKAPVHAVKPAAVQPLHTLPSSMPDDSFSKGRIVKYFPQSKYGFIKDRRGKDVYFNVDEVRFVGAKGREALREGILVGYDKAWTSHGLHISKIKIY
ncbi:MAG: hypothetical protein U1F57_11010 [bacterium]